MKLFLGSDHAGFDLKVEVLKNLKLNGYDVVDCGCFSGKEAVDYPDVAVKLCKEVVLKKARGLLFCGTGVGMAMAANKVDGIRAVCGVDSFSVKFSRLHNDANVLCLGGRVLGLGLALLLVDLFLKTDFEGGRHNSRLEKLKLIKHNEFSI